MLLAIVLVIVGFCLLIFGANWMVEGASMLAKKYNISDLAIGLTIVAFGTSAPELVVNTIASTNGYSDIILGNIIGSNNFNLFIILGITGAIFPISVKSSTCWKEIPISFIAAALLLLFANDIFLNGFGFQGHSTSLSRIEGGMMLFLFFVFLYYVFTQMKNEDEPEAVMTNIKPLWKIYSLIIIGLTGLIVGGKLVVDNSVEIASSMGVSEKIIALTIVATGTSLPELLTSVVAALKKNSDIAIGNVIGSNIFNIFLILSISSIIKPISYNLKFNWDLLLLIVGTLLLLVFMLTGKKKKLDRWEAVILFLIYVSYTIYLVIQEI